MATMFAPKLSGPPDIAAPSAGAAIEGIRQTGQAISGALGIAGSIYEAKREEDISAAKSEVEKVRNEWFEKYQAAQVAEQDVAINRQRLSVAQSAMESLQEVDPERSMLVEVENRMKQDLEQSLGNLRQAQEQNKIGPAEYAVRVKTVEDKIRARYPGLRDRINQEIAKISGLPNAGDFAVYSFVQSQFAPRTADTSGAKAQAELETAETKWISQYTGVSVVDVNNSRAQDPVRFAEWKKIATGRAQDEAITQSIATRFKAETAVADSDADKAKPNIQLYARGTFATSLSSVVAKKPEILQAMLDATKGMGGAEMQQDAAYKAFAAVVDAELNRSEAAVINAMDNWGARLSDAKRAEVKRLIDDEKKGIKALMSDPNNMGAIAGILRDHADKSFDVRLKLIQNASSTMTALANTDIAKAWFRGDEASRTRIRNEFPPLAAWLEQNEQFIGNAASTLRDAYTGISQTVRVADQVNNAKANPEATPIEISTKVGHSAIAAIATDILKKPELSDTDKNILGTMLSNGTSGAAYKNLRSNETAIRAVLGKLTPDEQKTITLAAEKAYGREVQNRVLEWDRVSKQEGWKFPVVFTANGGVMLVAPETTQSRLGVITNVPAQGAPSIYASAEEWARYRAAQQAGTAGGSGVVDGQFELAKNYFDKTIAPVITAASLVRSIVTGEEKAVSAKAASDALNEKKFSQYLPFMKRSEGRTTGGPTAEELSSLAPVSAGEQQPTPGVPLADRTDKERAVDDVAAITRELKSIEKKPSWVSEAFWLEQKKILAREIEAAKKRAQ